MKKPAGDTRAAILAAAATEFASRGFDGTSVDTIAATSGFNKAMLYYHFENKLALYLEILRDGFRFIGSHTAQIADADHAPAEKLGQFISVFSVMAGERPYMPPMMMREMAEGAPRLDTDTLRLMGRIFGNLQRILDEGVALGHFRPADPFLTYFTLITPVIFFHASRPIREALGRQHIIDAQPPDAATFVRHVKDAALTVLTAGAKTPARPPRARRTRSTRPGVHA